MPDLYSMAATFGERFRTNVKGSVSSMTSQQWLRLITIVGAYMLLRPYLLKLVARLQAGQLEKAEAEEAAAEAEERARISPNELRGHKVDIPDDSSEDEDEDGTAKAKAAEPAQWGKKARRRQRQMVRKVLEDHERRLADQAGDEEDKDIEEFLVG